MKLNLLMLPATMFIVQLTVQSAPAPSVVMPQVAARQKQKVCGKAFIQIVIFSCGASCWKRTAMEDETGIPVLGSANNGKSSRIWCSFCHTLCTYKAV